jgi:divalent metal cation (Fe/Co/Zn/Cd) transporter
MTTTKESLRQQGLYLEYLSIAWAAVEAIASVWSGIVAHSVVLVGFGLDSAIEVFASLVVVWQLLGVGKQRERLALRMIAVSFFALAAYLLARSAMDLVNRAEPKESVVGIVVSGAALVVMPLLAWAKRRTGERLGSAPLMADATETALCALFSAATLGGLVLNATLGWWWADPVGGIVVAALAVKEGREAWEGHACGDCHL